MTFICVIWKPDPRIYRVTVSCICVYRLNLLKEQTINNTVDHGTSVTRLWIKAVARSNFRFSLPTAKVRNKWITAYKIKQKIMTNAQLSENIWSSWFSILPELPNIKPQKKNVKETQTEELLNLYWICGSLCRGQKQFIIDACANCWRVFLKPWDSTTLKLMC